MIPRVHGLRPWFSDGARRRGAVRTPPPLSDPAAYSGSGSVAKAAVQVHVQDCVVAEGDCVIWTGVAEYPNDAGGAFPLGGLANIDMNTGYLWHEVPVTALSWPGWGVTFDATRLEVSGDRLRMYALPADSDRPGSPLCSSSKPGSGAVTF